MEDCTPSKYSTGLLCRHAEESTEPGPFLFQSLEALAEAKRLKAEAPRPSPKQQVLTGFAFGLRCLFACQAEAAAGKKKKEASEQSSVLAVLAFVPIARALELGDSGGFSPCLHRPSDGIVQNLEAVPERC